MHGTKLYFVLFVLTLTINKAMSDKAQMTGGVKPIDLKQAEEQLKASLDKLAQGEEGPHFKLGKIHSAESQVVAGTLTKIVADLIDADGTTKKCNVSIWSRPWLPNGVEVTFKCENEEKITRKHDA